MKPGSENLDICQWPERVGVPSVGGSRPVLTEVLVLLQRALLAASRRPGLRRAVVGNPATRRVVDRFVPGETLDDALGAVRRESATGIQGRLDHLGEDVTDRTEAIRTRDG